MQHTGSSAFYEQLMGQFIKACRNGGLKVTHQRTEVYRKLLTHKDHPSAEILHKRLLPSLPSISLDTVYRTLATLEEHGLVSRIQTSESQARFEAVIESHHHLICSRCKNVQDFQWPEIEKLDLPDTICAWGEIHSRNLVMYGVCNSCSSR